MSYLLGTALSRAICASMTEFEDLRIRRGAEGRGRRGLVAAGPWPAGQQTGPVFRPQAQMRFAGRGPPRETSLGGLRVWSGVGVRSKKRAPEPRDRAAGARRRRPNRGGQASQDRPAGRPGRPGGGRRRGGPRIFRLRKAGARRAEDGEYSDFGIESGGESRTENGSRREEGEEAARMRPVGWREFRWDFEGVATWWGRARGGVFRYGRRATPAGSRLLHALHTLLPTHHPYTAKKNRRGGDGVRRRGRP